MTWLLRILLLIGLVVAPAHAKPKAIAGEPEITKAGKGMLGQTVYHQVFSLPPHGFVAPDLTIAERFWLVGAVAPLKPMSIEVSCSISLDGSVYERNCRPKTNHSSTAYAMLRLAKSSNQFPQFPQYRAIEEIIGDKWSLSRFVEFTLVSPEFAPAEVDLDAGPLLDKSLFQSHIAQAARRLHYPSRALRHEVEGDQEIECQVQADRSVICRTLNFSVAEHADIFSRDIKRLFEGERIETELADGTNPAGARFRFNIVWRLP